MKVILLVVSFMFFLVMAVIGIGYLLPQDHIATGSAEYTINPEDIWQYITQKKNTDGVTYETVESIPLKKFVTRIADKDLPFGGTWTYEIEATPKGSRLTITENGEVYNPLFRFISRFIIGHQRTIEKYLKEIR